MSVAIIGAGVSGLAAAACALKVGLQPIVYEQAPAAGGLWNTDTQPYWSSLRTNLSKFSTVLPSFPWPKDSPLFPSQTEVHEYLAKFKRTLPDSIFNFNSKVTEIARDGNEWRVASEVAGVKTCKQFKFVIVATGFFSAPHIPKGLLQAGGRTKVLHSTEYRNPQDFVNKKVIVVGASLSATDIAADVAPSAAEVVHVASHPFWCLPRFLPLNPTAASPTFLPLDLVLYRSKGRNSLAEQTHRTAEGWQRVNTSLGGIYGGQPCNCPSEEFDSAAPVNVAITDSYYQLVQSGRIRLMNDRVQELNGDSLLLESGQTISISPSHIVIACTGYRPQLRFLSQEVLEMLQYSPEDCLSQLILHRSMLHPDLLGLGFIGMYRGPFWPVIYLQAEWLTKVFAGVVETPTREEMQTGLEVELAIRNQVPRPQFPHGDYVGLCCDLSASLNRKPALDSPNAEINGILVANALRDPEPDAEVEAELQELCSTAPKGKLVAAAVMQSLRHSQWQFTRKLHGQPLTGSATGRAEFSCKQQQQQMLHYSESGDLQLPNNQLLPFTRQYAYEYDSNSDCITVYFVEDSQPSREFHKMQFTASDEGWVANGDHLCGNDRYLVEYRFQFNGCHLASFSIAYRVTGPNKDYHSSTQFTPVTV